ncbi:MAG: PepSY domain-containing protein [Methyloceanibacter sp.]|jgi:hypothetical protein|nr:PepSY domain-containing protein [Methyloceanibacter sp.]
MIRIFIAALMLVVTSLPVMAHEVPPEAMTAIAKALAEIGCTVEADEVDATDDGYEADDVECKDGEFEVTFDKDFKIKSKEKDEY